MSFRQEAEAERNYLVSIRRWLHSHPELSRQEYGTAERIERELDTFGLAHSRVGETGVYGLLRGEGAGRVFGLHAASNVPVGKIVVKPGPNNASVDRFIITVHGQAAHVSTPQLGVDALYIASQIVISVQAVITRQLSPVDSTIIGIGKLSAGTAYNIVADTAVLEGTTRAFTVPQRKFVNERVEEIAKQTAVLYGGSAEVEWIDNASPLVNDEALSREIGAIVVREFGPEALIAERELSLGGDDFAEFQLRVPGVYAYIGTGNTDKPNTVMPHHCGLFDIDENALPIAAALYAEVAYSYLTVI